MAAVEFSGALNALQEQLPEEGQSHGRRTTGGFQRTYQTRSCPACTPKRSQTRLESVWGVATKVGNLPGTLFATVVVAELSAVVLCDSEGAVHVTEKSIL